MPFCVIPWLHRQTGEQGEWPAACIRCKLSEQAGARSVRQDLNDRFDQGRKRELLRQTHEDGSLDQPMGGPLNNYIRRPSRWRDIDRNLRVLDASFDPWKLPRVPGSVTVQTYNALTLNQLFEYLRVGGLSRIEPLPQLVPLLHPPYLSIQVLPAAAKAIARERLQAGIERAESWNRPGLETLINSMRFTNAFTDAADTTANLPGFLASVQRTACVEAAKTSSDA